VKVVIDTNVLISAVLRDRVPQDVLLFVSETPGIEWIASPEIMAEYKTVLARKKFDLPADKVQHWLVFLDETVKTEEVGLNISFERDRRDAKFLACALNTGADWFITGDRDFESAENILGTTLISVSMFKRAVIAHWNT
jgi:putative PIN family toxin of toxin-antitoxin system